MKKTALLIILCAFFTSCIEKEKKYTTIDYSVPFAPWEDEIKVPGHQAASPDKQPTAPNNYSMGNHRALIRVPAAGEVARLDLEWRRHDKNVDKPRFILIHKQTQDTVKNIYRAEVNNEHCEILFGPVDAGEYYFYYLPFEKQGGWNLSYGKDYLSQEPSPDIEWLTRNKVKDPEPTNSINAECIEIQSRTEFDSFYPMEVIATEEEKEVLIASNPRQKFLLFPEDRRYPIRMLDNIPQKWVLQPISQTFEGTACKNEYYAFQIGLWALENIEDVKVEFTPLKGNRFTLPISAITCFNTGGTDPSGKTFSRIVNVAKEKVQPLWIGLDLPKEIPEGKYEGSLTVTTKNAGKQQIEIRIRVTNELLADRGDNEPWRHSRLRWLNSTLGIDDEPVPPWQPIETKNKIVYLSGKEVAVTKEGLPSSIKAFGEEILAAPVEFMVETFQEKINFNLVENKILKQTNNLISQEYTLEGSDDPNKIQLVIRSEIESDGWMKYLMEITALQNIDIRDIQLKIPFKKEHATYLSGMDLYGARTPDHHEAKWDPMYDAFWLGSTKAGLYCELRGASYSGPLVHYLHYRNFYNPSPPESWYNDNKGGFRIQTRRDHRDVFTFSGSRRLKKGETIAFECAFIITPIKKQNTPYHFTNKYFQNQFHPEPSEKDAALGVKVANLHHANKFNPHINYPFASKDVIKGYVDRCHEKGIKANLYYSTRELSNFATEIWAFRSLGHEILAGGNGGGYPWLREHLVDDYAPEWYQFLGNPKGADAAVLTSFGMTRFFNYYIEDLKWLVENVGIDGIYIDAAGYDRKIVRRMKKAMEAVKSGCLLDLHEGKNSFLRYLEFFPYLDKTWIGEHIDYDKTDPVEYLVSISNIPMGFISDMLQEGGNPWRGMVYGMTTRYGWTTNGIFCDPTPVWKVWDDFGIADSRMIGYWEEQPLVTTSNEDVLATSYLKDGKMLISIASWAAKPVKIKLNIDFIKANINPKKISITAPFIKDFQPEKKFSLNEPIPVEPTKGWLLVLEEQ